VIIFEFFTINLDIKREFSPTMIKDSFLYVATSFNIIADTLRIFTVTLSNNIFFYDLVKIP